MHLRYNYRMYPNDYQISLFHDYIDGTRALWNYFLNLNEQEYDLNKHFIWFKDMANALPKMKRTEQFAWLKSIHSQVLQQTLKDLDIALHRCRKKISDFPNYKCKKNFNGSFRYAQGVHIDKNASKVRLPNIGWVKFDNHRDMPCKPKSATIILNGQNWYISFTVEKQEELRHELTRFVGIDLGIKSFAITSDGVDYENKKFLDKSLKQLRKEQRRLSRKQKGSKNRKKQQLKVHNLHKKIRNKRLNYLHQISSQITNEYDLIFIEDLAVKNMVKNHCLSKAISQQGWSMFGNMLSYKSHLKGGLTIKINRWLPSTKTCSNCGHVKYVNLSERTYICPECGLEIDRDVNAAINIKNFGLNTAGTAGIYACGVDVRPCGDMPLRQSALKQEAKCSLGAW